MPFAIGALISGGLGLASSLIGSSSSGDAASAQQNATDQSVAEQAREFNIAQGMLAPYNQMGINAMPAMSQFLGIPTPTPSQYAPHMTQGITPQSANPITPTGAQMPSYTYNPQTLNVTIPKEYQALFDIQKHDLLKNYDQAAAASHLSGTPMLTSRSSALGDLEATQSATGYNAGLSRALTERNMNYGSLLDMLNLGSGKAAQGAGLAVNTGANIGNTLMQGGANLANIYGQQGAAAAALPFQALSGAGQLYGLNNMMNAGALTQGINAYGTGGTNSLYGVLQANPNSDALATYASGLNWY